MGRQLSAEEIAIFRDCFNEYDQDQGGNITVDEFGRVMRKTTPNISDAEVAKIISEVDLDGDGTINFDEFITMMTGQPYKSPETLEQEAKAAAAAQANGSSTGADGTPGSIVNAVRGVSAVSARLQRQRLANQVYKDAWATIDPSLEGSVAPDEFRRAAARAGLAPVADADVEELMGMGRGDDGRALASGLTYAQFLEFAKRQEVDDIVSGYGD